MSHVHCFSRRYFFLALHDLDFTPPISRWHPSTVVMSEPIEIYGRLKLKPNCNLQTRIVQPRDLFSFLCNFHFATIESSKFKSLRIGPRWAGSALHKHPVYSGCIRPSSSYLHMLRKWECIHMVYFSYAYAMYVHHHAMHVLSMYSFYRFDRHEPEFSRQLTH